MMDEAAYTVDDSDDSRLSALANTIRLLRDDAVEGRAASGIEAEWLEDEEYYEGIDDANRSEKHIKPTSPDGRVRIEKSQDKKSARSSVFVNITRPYVNAAAAKVADMLFPTDDSNYGMRPTPIPDLIQKELDNTPAFDDTGNPITKTLIGDDGQPVMEDIESEGGMIQQPVQRQATNGDMAKDEMRRAKEACEKAKQQIDDWLVQCSYHGEGRQIIEDAARLGTGVLKGPFPESVRRRSVVRALEGIGIVIKDEIVPKSRRIDVWNFYPDKSCGESIHNGKYVFERDDINARQLQDLKRDPSYISSAIDRIIEEGPKSHTTGTLKRGRGEKPNSKEVYDIWYYTGYLSKKDLIAAGYEFGNDDPGLIESSGIDQTEIHSENAEYTDHSLECNDENEQYPAIVVMVNDAIIKATMQPLDSGEFPYDVMPWQRRSGHWAGIGVARQMRTSQDGVNAATRNMMDNAGVSGSPILIIDRSKIVPADGKWNIGPHKVYYTAEGAEIGNIRDAFTWIISPSMQIELMNIIQFWMQRSEDETGLPMLLQGQMGKAPDTVGGMTMLNNNASSVLRRIARIFDDRITEPHIGRYYEWLLMYGDDDSMKGDFTIDARGSSALIERDSQAMILPQILAASVNPAFGLDPELVMEEMIKYQRFDIEKMRLSSDKKAQIAQGQQTDPRVAVAQMNIEARGNEKQAELSARQEVEMARQEFEAREAALDRALEQWAKTVDAQIAQAQLSGEQAMNMDNLKVALAKNTANLRTQVKLAMGNSQVATPAVEPIGRAPNGEAFQK